MHRLAVIGGTGLAEIPGFALEREEPVLARLAQAWSTSAFPSPEHTAYAQSLMVDETVMPCTPSAIMEYGPGKNDVVVVSTMPISK